MSLDKFERSNHMKKEYQYKTTGNCRAESVVQGKDWRFYRTYASPDKNGI